MTPPYPFSAVVGLADLRLSLLLNAVSPAIGGVLVRGEKGTAKSTVVRALAALLPGLDVVAGCRFSCDPAAPYAACPDAQRHQGWERRPARLVELPVGATEDRLVGALDLERALTAGQTHYEPGLLAAAHRGVLYVDEVNLLHDHLVDLLLDAAAMGEAYVERDGVSVRHAARFLLVGTMNPEEGELRPQLLDRFGLAVEVRAPREARERAEVVRRRLAYETDPGAFAADWAAADASLAAQIEAARDRLSKVDLPDGELTRIAHVCAAFEVDGMRADIVVARTAMALAAWHERDVVTADDVRAAARLALPHRRRRSPFDAPGLDERALDEAMQAADDDTDPDGGGSPNSPRSSDISDEGQGGGRGGEAGQSGQGDHSGQSEPGDQSGQEGQGGAAGGSGRGDRQSEGKSGPREAEAWTVDSSLWRDISDGINRSEQEQTGGPGEGASRLRGGDGQSGERAQGSEQAGQGGRQTDGREAGAKEPQRARLFAVPGMGHGAAGRRSPAYMKAGTRAGRAVGSRPGSSGLHLVSTLRAAAPHQEERGRQAGPLVLRRQDLREPIRQGRESNLVLFCVDASGSMAARQRMSAVKTAVLSLLLDAYQRRDKVGLVTFRGNGAELALPPTSSVEAGAARLRELPTGGRTPLAKGLLKAAEILGLERMRDPQRRPLLVVVTDGRATSGEDPTRVADYLAQAGVASVVVDCESGFIRLGLAEDLAIRLKAEHVRLEEVTAQGLTRVARRRAA